MSRNFGAVRYKTEDNRVTGGGGDAHDKRQPVIAQRQENVDHEQDMRCVGGSQWWQLGPVVEGLDHVDGDEHGHDNAGRDEGDPRLLPHDLLAERDEEGGPNNKDTGQVGEHLDGDR